MIQKEITQAQKFIKEADAILITAGAGMGVDSGLPDFRGNSGFWKAYPVIKNLGIAFEEMANPQWFQTNPSLAWAFYGHRLNLYKTTRPHKGFKLLLELVKKKNNDYFVFTSNVDGQFQKAGFLEDKICEVHGSIHHFQCTQNCTEEIWKTDIPNINIDLENFLALDITKCKNCASVARPNILMFGDRDWNFQRTAIQEEKFNQWIQKMNKQRKKVVIIEIGAGIAIPTIRMEGENLASKYSNFQLIRINPREYAVDGDFGVSIPFGGLDALEKIVII